MFSGKLVLIIIFHSFRSIGIVFLILKLFCVLFFLVGQFKEEHKSSLCNVHVYIKRVTVHRWEDNFKMFL